jgi:hypothetical protein
MPADVACDAMTGDASDPSGDLLDGDHQRVGEECPAKKFDSSDCCHAIKHHLTRTEGQARGQHAKIGNFNRPDSLDTSLAAGHIQKHDTTPSDRKPHGQPVATASADKGRAEMTGRDKEIVLNTLDRAIAVVSAYVEPGLPRNAAATVNELIAILDNQELAGALRRMGRGLRAVK